MNSIKTLITSLGAAGLLVSGASAQNTGATVTTGAAGTTGATTTETTTITGSGTAAAKTAASDVGISARDGITLSGTEVLITRNGVTETVRKEVSLENGTRVMPDGTVVTPNGGKITLRASQVLGFDGKIMDAPVSNTGTAGNTGATGVNTVPATGGAATTTTTTTGTATTTTAAGDIADSEAQRREKAAQGGAGKQQ